MVQPVPSEATSTVKSRQKSSRQIQNRMQTRALRIAITMCLATWLSKPWIKLPERLSAAQISSVELVPDSSVSVRVNADHKGTVRFRIGSDQFFRIGIENSPAEASLSLYTPDRQLKRSTPCKRGGGRISEIGTAT